jgi:hypothetical protein
MHDIFFYVYKCVEQSAGQSEEFLKADLLILDIFADDVEIRFDQFLYTNKRSLIDYKCSVIAIFSSSTKLNRNDPKQESLYLRTKAESICSREDNSLCDLYELFIIF